MKTQMQTYIHFPTKKQPKSIIKVVRMNILYISLFQELYKLYFKSSKFKNYLFQYHKYIILVFNNSLNLF